MTDNAPQAQPPSGDWGTTPEGPPLPPHGPAPDDVLAQVPEASDDSPSAELRAGFARLRTEVGKAVVGQDAAVTGLVIALLCRGHVLLEGVQIGRASCRDRVYI